MSRPGGTKQELPGDGAELGTLSVARRPSGGR